jgi:hypothetical protein
MNEVMMAARHVAGADTRSAGLPMSEPVRIETHPTADGRHIGMLTLDSPASSTP